MAGKSNLASNDNQSRFRRRFTRLRLDLECLERYHARRPLAGVMVKCCVSETAQEKEEEKEEAKAAADSVS